MGLEWNLHWDLLICSWLMTNMAICCLRLESSSCKALILPRALGSEVIETEDIMVEFIRGMSSARTVNKSSVSSSYTLSSSVSLSPSSFLALFVIYYINTLDTCNWTLYILIWIFSMRNRSMYNFLMWKKYIHSHTAE